MVLNKFSATNAVVIDLQAHNNTKEGYAQATAELAKYQAKERAANIEVLGRNALQLRAAADLAKSKHQAYYSLSLEATRAENIFAMAQIKNGAAMIQGAKNAADLAKSYEHLKETVGALYSMSVQAAKYFAAPILALDALAIKNAAWAIEMENLFKVTTGRMTEMGWEWTKNLEKQTGISQTKARQMVGIFHVMITAIGVAEEKAMKMATNLTKLGYDISSFYNVPVEVAFEKLQSGIVGLPRGLKTLGIVVTEAMVKQWALTNAFIKQGEIMTEQQEVFARYNVIMEQTSKAQGDMARTMGSPQNQIRILGERFYELSVQMGKQLMGPFQIVMKVLLAFISILQNIPGPIKLILTLLTSLPAVFIIISVGVLKAIKMFLAWNLSVDMAAAKLGAMGKVIGVVTKAFIRLEQAMRLAPLRVLGKFTAILIVITAIAYAISLLKDKTQKYADQLEVVTEKLKDEFLTIKDKNKLLAEQLALQTKLATLKAKEEARVTRPGPDTTSLKSWLDPNALRNEIVAFARGGQEGLEDYRRGGAEAIKISKDYLKAAKEAGVAATTMGAAQRILGEKFVEYLKLGGDSVLKYKEQLTNLELKISATTGATKTALEEDKVKLVEKMKQIELGRLVAVSAAKEKGFLFETYNISKNMIEMLKDSPAAVRAIVLTIQGLDPAMAAVVDRQREAADELMKIEGISQTMMKSSKYKTQTEIREQFAALELVYKATVDMGITNEMDRAMLVGKLFKDALEDNAIMLKYNHETLKDKERLLVIAQQIALLEAGVAAGGFGGFQTTLGTPKPISMYKNQADAANAKIKAFEEERNKIFAKTVPDVKSFFTQMSDLFTKGTNAIKEIPRELKKVVGEAERLATHMEASAKYVEAMQKDSEKFNTDLNVNMSLDFTSMEKDTEKVLTDFRRKQEAIKLKGPFGGENPVAAEAREIKAAWEDTRKVLQERKEAIIDYYKKQAKVIKDHYELERDKLKEYIDMEKLKLGVVKEVETSIIKIREAAKGNDIKAIEAAIAEGLVKLDAMKTAALTTIIDPGENQATIRLNQFLIDSLPTLGKIHTAMVNSVTLENAEVAEAALTWQKLDGVWVKTGKRMNSAFKQGLAVLADNFRLVAGSLGSFFGTGSFGQGLSDFFTTFATGLDEVYQKQELIKGQAGTMAEFTAAMAESWQSMLSPKNMAAFGTILGNMVGGKSSLSGIGAALGGSLLSGTDKEGNPSGIGTLLGKTFGKLAPTLMKAIPIVGGVLGGLVGGLFGKLFKSKAEKAAEKEADRLKKAMAQVTKSMAYLGKISEETAKSIATAMKTMSEHAATSKYFANVIEDVGVNQKNVNNLWARATEIFKDMENKSLTVGEATTALSDSFTAMLEGAKKLGTEGSNAMVKFIKAAQDSGEKISAVIDYVNEQLGVTQEGILGAARGLEMMVGGTAKGLEDLMTEKAAIEEALTDRLLRGYARRLKEKELRGVMEKIAASAKGFEFDIERAGRLAFATFNEMIKNGVSVRDAFASIGPTLDMLVVRYKAMGTEASASIQELLHIRDVQTKNEALFDAIEGNKIVMESLYNVGGLTQDLFYDAQDQMGSYLDQLVLAGLTREEALAMLIPTMEKINSISKEREWNINNETQALIDEAAASGQLAEGQLSFVDAILAGFGQLIFELTGRMPAAFQRSSDALDRQYQRQQDRERKNKEDNAKSGDAYIDTVEDVGRSSTNATDDMARGWSGVTDAITGAANAAEDYARAADIGFTTTTTTTGRRNTDNAEEIHASSGGTWKVTGKEQVFRAHQGETVTVYRPESRSTPNTEANPSAPSMTNTFKFDISTLDADSFERLVQKKLIPLLERYTKSEAFLIHPNAVRRF